MKGQRTADSLTKGSWGQQTFLSNFGRPVIWQKQYLTTLFFSLEVQTINNNNKKHTTNSPVVWQQAIAQDEPAPLVSLYVISPFEEPAFIGVLRGRDGHSGLRHHDSPGLHSVWRGSGGEHKGLNRLDDTHACVIHTVDKTRAPGMFTYTPKLCRSLPRQHFAGCVWVDSTLGFEAQPKSFISRLKRVILNILVSPTCHYVNPLHDVYRHEFKQNSLKSSVYDRNKRKQPHLGLF